MCDKLTDSMLHGQTNQVLNEQTYLMCDGQTCEEQKCVTDRYISSITKNPNSYVMDRPIICVPDRQVSCMTDILVSCLTDRQISHVTGEGNFIFILRKLTFIPFGGY